MIGPQRPILKETLAILIHNCKNIRILKQIHSHVLTSHDLSPTDRSFLVSRLLFFLCTASLSPPSSLLYARQLFDLIRNPSLFVYNAMIRANATIIKNPSSCESLVLYRRMRRDGLSPDCITFPFVLKECSKRGDGAAGRSVHGNAIVFGFGDDVYVQNALVSFYGECGGLEDARKVFDGMSRRDAVSWNSMIVACLRSGEIDEAMGLFRGMEERKSVVTWNSVITGLVQGGRGREALEVFYEMRDLRRGEDVVVAPDKMTVASAIAACASLGAVDHGRQVHRYLERSGIECDIVIGTALVDMYGKCGFVERAFEVFRGMADKDVLAWTAMISVLALHGFGNVAFELFAEMEAEGVRPNAVTFTGLLSACAHSGLVEKGRWCFDMMRDVYRIEPQVQHYACMVDILGRAGLFTEAEDLIRSMPMSPDAFVWGSLLGGCQMHGNFKLGEKVARYLIDLDPENHAFYINLCDLYAKAGRFDDRKRIRSLMKDLEIWKSVPGCSMIEIDGVVYEFSVRGPPGMLMETIKNVLVVLNYEMKMEWDISSIIR